MTNWILNNWDELKQDDLNSLNVSWNKIIEDLIKLKEFILIWKDENLVWLLNSIANKEWKTLNEFLTYFLKDLQEYIDFIDWIEFFDYEDYLEIEKKAEKWDLFEDRYNKILYFWRTNPVEENKKRFRILNFLHKYPFLKGTRDKVNWIIENKFQEKF